MNHYNFYVEIKYHDGSDRDFFSTTIKADSICKCLATVYDRVYDMFDASKITPLIREISKVELLEVE